MASTYSEGHYSSSSLKPEHFEIKQWNAVAFWAWELVSESCPFCRNLLGEACISCQVSSGSSTREECIVAWGKCHHAFHVHCINLWWRRAPPVL
ncbi:hypothetical protein SUGI_0446810 [Cryptomeria japonica]|nr:hypothetical protein SUGI_0446810 [Cryptomeria japonica]